MRRLPLALIVLAAFAAVAAPSASADGAWGSNGCGTSEKRPSLIAFTCGDGSVVFEADVWSRWFINDAVATGYLKHPNTEDPSCAGRPISACPVVESAATVTLSASAYCSGNLRFQYLRLRLEAPEDPDPELRTITRRFKCSEYAKPKPPRRHKQRRSYWRDCGLPASYALKTVVAHRVNCVKAKRLIRRVWRVGQESGPGGAIRVKSFDCVLTGGNRPILCERGSHKVRGPLPG